MELERKRCKKCNEPIYFIRMQSGAYSPVNIAPVKVIKSGSDKYTIITASGKTLMNPPDGATGYISHFATCKFASNFRRRAITRKQIGKQKTKKGGGNEDERRDRDGSDLFGAIPGGYDGDDNL